MTVLKHKQSGLGKGVVLTRQQMDAITRQDTDHIAPPPKKNPNEPFCITVDQYHVAYLQKTQQNLEPQLKDFYATLHIDKVKNEVQIAPSHGNECVEDWRSCCQGIVDTFIKGIKVETVGIPWNKKELMHPVIDEATQTEHSLCIECKEDITGHYIVIITGEDSGVTRVKRKLEDIRESFVCEKLYVPDELMRPAIDEAIHNEKMCYVKYEDQSTVSIKGKESEVIRIKRKLEDICKRFTKELFKIPHNKKKDLMHPVIEKIRNETHLHLEYTEDKSFVWISGEKSEVTRTKKKLEEICETIVVDEKFPVSSEKFYTLLFNAALQNLRDKHRKVKIEDLNSVYAGDHSVYISMTGFINDCEQLKSDLSELSSNFQCIPVLLTAPYNQLMITQPDKALIKFYFGNYVQKNITFYIENDKLYILGASESQASIEALMQEIQNTLCCIPVPYPAKFQKYLQNSRDPQWYHLLKEFEKTQLVQFSYAVNTIKVTGHSRVCEPAKMEIEDFIRHHGVSMKRISLDYGQWKLIQMHLNEKWSKLVQECKLQKRRKKELRILAVHDKKPYITLEADVQYFKEAEEKIERFLSTIVFSLLPIKVKVHGVIEYFCSQIGRSAVGKIEADAQSYVHITDEDGNTDLSTLVSRDSTIIQHTTTQFNMVCTGCSGNVKVNLYHGDITMLPVDVMVNATDPQLKHTRGVADAIATVGVPSIQKESDASLQSVGTIKKGAVIEMKEVGDLPCKCLLHVVSPAWHDGTHGESSLLKQACITALQMASHFRTISFPAIGCSSDEFPAIVCAKTMIEAVLTHGQEYPSSSITDISFVVHDQCEVDEFAKIMNKQLSNVSFPSGMPKALVSASTLSPTTPKCIVDNYVIEDDGDLVIISEQDESASVHSTRIYSNHCQIGTTGSTIHDPSCAMDDYIELLNGKLLQHPVSFYD